MILADMSFSFAGRPPSLASVHGHFSTFLSDHADTLLPSGPMILLIASISVAYAQCGSAACAEGGRLPRLDLLRGGGALLHAVGRLAADPDARERDGDAAARAPPTRRQPDGGRPDAGWARGGHPRAPGRGRGFARGDRGPARGAPANGVVPDRRRDADAARDRDLPRPLPRRRAHARGGRAGGDRAAAARR